MFAVVDGLQNKKTPCKTHRSKLPIISSSSQSSIILSGSKGIISAKVLLLAPLGEIVI